MVLPDNPSFVVEPSRTRVPGVSDLWLARSLRP